MGRAVIYEPQGEWVYSRSLQATCGGDVGQDSETCRSADMCCLSAPTSKMNFPTHSDFMVLFSPVLAELDLIVNSH